MTPLSMRLFGTFQVTLDGTAVSGFASDKVRALLIYLAIESDQPQRREKLAGLLWPDFPEPSAHANLRTALANLRQVIGDASTTPPYLFVSRQAIQVNRASGAWIDVDSYIELLNLADLTSLEQAARLYRGDLLEGFSLGDASPFEEWALLERERYRRLAMDALGRLTDGYLQRGDYERALLHAWRQSVLGDDAQTDAFMAAYGVTPGGNFEGKNILELVGDLDQRPALAEARRKLFAAREHRVHPGHDDKVLTSWNGLMLAAFADAARGRSRGMITVKKLSATPVSFCAS